MLLYDFIPGASIGITKTLIGYPFETLKNKKELNKKKNIYIKDLYKGCSIPLLTYILDGDEIRENISKGLGFSKKDRSINIRRIGYISNIITTHGGIISSIITNPLNIIKTNIQTKNYNNIK